MPRGLASNQMCCPFVLQAYKSPWMRGCSNRILFRVFSFGGSRIKKNIGQPHSLHSAAHTVAHSVGTTTFSSLHRTHNRSFRWGSCIIYTPPHTQYLILSRRRQTCKPLSRFNPFRALALAFQESVRL